jgi:2-oxoglutarate ferredoxin oxidoreductase subunit alpha
VRADGHAVSSMHLKFLQPMAPGIKAAMHRFKHVMTVENNWCDKLGDEMVDEENRRYSNLSLLLRARCLVDIDCWGEVAGRPIKPGTIERVIREKLGLGGR